MKSTLKTIIKATIAGKRLLMHNGQLADPLNEYTKALKKLTGVKKKTEAVYLEMAKAEFMGSLYFDEDLGPILPAELLEACITDGAKASKLGKVFKAAVECVDPFYKLEYSGPRTREALFATEKFRDARGVRINQSRVIRMRPRFGDWRATFELVVDASDIDVSDVRHALEVAGERVGIGDYRPKFGRFEVESFATV